MEKTRSVEHYIEKHPEWAAELTQLRGLLLACGLTEEIKWGAPCYMAPGPQGMSPKEINSKRKLVNCIGMLGFKSYVGLWFHQGADMADPQGVLINAQEGKTQLLRQWRMQKGDQIIPAQITAYAHEAIAVAARLSPNHPRLNSGTKKTAAPQNKGAADIPKLLESALALDAELHTAFEALTPARKRDHIAFINDAKQEATKLRRLTKAIPMINTGKGPYGG
ncbi:MAG: YdeI/OmpD-associated family protein [Maricaulaceae bacterium]